MKTRQASVRNTERRKKDIILGSASRKIPTSLPLVRREGKANRTQPDSSRIEDDWIGGV